MKEQEVESELDRQHVAAEQWLNDILFYEVETTFFLTLVDRYFTLMLREEHINDAQIVVTQIHFLQKEIAGLKDELMVHNSHIAKRYDDRESYDEMKLRVEHAALNSDIRSCVEDYRRTKKSVFGLSAKLIEVSKLAHRLKA